MSSGGGGTSTTTTTQELSPEQRQLLKPVIPIAQDFLNTDLELFPGSTVAQPTEAQQIGRQEIATQAAGPVRDLANQTVSNVGTTQNLAGSASEFGLGQMLTAGEQSLGGLTDILGENQQAAGSRAFLQSGALLDPATNPVLGAQIEGAINPVQRRLQEEVLPGIASDFVGNNMFGSSRQGIAEGQAVGEFADTAAQIAAELQANNFNQGLGAMLNASLAPLSAAGEVTGQGLEAGSSGLGNAAGLLMQSLQAAPEAGSFAFTPGLTMEGLGRMEQADDQARLNEAASRFMTEQMLPFMQAQDVANLAMGLGGGSSVATSQLPDQGGGIMDILGPLAMFAFL